MKHPQDERTLTKMVMQDEAVFKHLINELEYVEKHGQTGRLVACVELIKNTLANHEK